MKIPMLMTPGPTYIHEEVRRAMSMEITNPDLDLGFFEFYGHTCDKLKQLMNTQNDVLIMSGEGILGLEAACASLIEPGDKVLCIENGIFGKGFGDFAKMYGGVVTYFSADYRHAIDPAALEAFLKDSHDFKVATLVHCETPSGITNPVKDLCPLLNSYGILTVIDSVSAVGGEPLETDTWKMDMVLGGSQKCLSAPPGLTFFSISSEAWKKILERKTPVQGFYTNIANWRNWREEKWFPYTQPISDIYALAKAADRLLADASATLRHKNIADAVRQSITTSGLELYPLDGFSNTVTTVMMPAGISSDILLSEMLKKHNIMLAGAFDFLKGKVFRIGHMGENCREEKLYITLKAINEVLVSNNVQLKSELHFNFAQLKI